MFDSFKTPEDSQEVIFSHQKEQVLDFVMNGKNRPETIEGRIDKGIVKLVEKFNSLPFLFTTSNGSCEGHVVGNLNNVRYFTGYISFETDGFSTGNMFVDEVEKILSKFPGAYLERIEPFTSGGEYVSGGFKVGFDDENKNGEIFPREEALRFEAQGKEIIKELEDLTDKFIS